MGLGWLAGLAGSAIQGAFGSHSARKQMAFQERMARNAHQYEVEDLRKAGLNPILSAVGGSGAYTPSGAMASISSDAGSGITTARKLAEVEKKVADAEIRLKNTTSDKNESDITVNDSQKAAIAEGIRTQLTTQAVNSAQVANIQAQTVSELERAKNIAASTIELGAKTKYHTKNLDFLDAGIRLATAQAIQAGTTSALQQAQIHNIDQDTRNKGLDYYLKKNEADFQRDNPNISKGLNVAERIVGMLSPIKFTKRIK